MYMCCIYIPLCSFFHSCSVPKTVFWQNNCFFYPSNSFRHIRVLQVALILAEVQFSWVAVVPALCCILFVFRAVRITPTLYMFRGTSVIDCNSVILSNRPLSARGCVPVFCVFGCLSSKDTLSDLNTWPAVSSSVRLRLSRNEQRKSQNLGVHTICSDYVQIMIMFRFNGFNIF